MGFLSGIFKSVKKIAKPAFKFLSGDVLGGISSGLGALGQAKDLIKGPESSVLSNKDFNRSQSQLDTANTNEVGRQSSFLTGVAPARAEAHNTYQNDTFAEDTRRTKERMDTLYPGTSAWERLGSPGSAPLPAPSGGESNPAASPQFLAQATQAATQLKAAKINQQTSLQTAQINARSQQNVAEIQNQPKEVANQNTAQQIKQQFAQIQMQGARWSAMTRQARQDAVIKAYSDIAKILPKEEYNLLVAKGSRVMPKQFRSFVQNILSEVDTKTERSYEGILTDGPLWSMKNDLAKATAGIGIAKGITNTARSIGGGIKATKRFLGGSNY